METWEKRCWQCILLGYIVVPLLLLRLPTTSDIGDSYVQYITTVLSALGRAVVDTVFIHLLGGAAMAWFLGLMDICVFLVNSILDVLDHLWNLASFLHNCAKFHMQGKQPASDPFDGIEQMIWEYMNWTEPLQYTCVHAAMHRDPYKTDTGDYTLLSGSCVQTNFRSSPYSFQSGDFTLLHDSCILRTLASDPYDVHNTPGTHAPTNITKSSSRAAVYTADGFSSSEQGACPVNADTVGNVTHSATPSAVIMRQPAASILEHSSSTLGLSATPSEIAIDAADADSVAASVSNDSKPRIASCAADVVSSNNVVNLEASAAVVGMTATVAPVFTTAPALGSAAFDPSVQATPLLTAAAKAAFVSNVEAMESIDEATMETYGITKPSLQKRLSAKFSSALALKRLSPNLSKKASFQPSLASFDSVDSIDEVTSAPGPHSTLPAKARSMLRRSTSSFKIAAHRVSSAVTPACFGAR